MIAERAFITILIIVTAVLSYWLFHWWQRQQINGRIASQPELLYFRSDSCAACPAQASYLEKIAPNWRSKLNIRKIDVDTEPETAVAYRIMSLPTTMIIKQDGEVHAINYGLTSHHKLNKQLERLNE